MTTASKNKVSKEKAMKKTVFTKVLDFDRRVFYVDRDRIQIERVREYGKIEKYATFDGNGYDRDGRRLGYVLETRVYFSNFDMGWDSATSGWATATDKKWQRGEVCCRGRQSTKFYHKICGGIDGKYSQRMEDEGFPSPPQEF